MSFVYNLAKFAVIPIKKCLSFERDACFQKAKQTLIDTGLKWTDLIASKSANINGHEFLIPKMDSVFFLEDRFEILIDVRGFQPEEIKCKITPNKVDVYAQKMEKMDATTKSMALARSYHLPQNVAPIEGHCCLSIEGILLITAPWCR